MGSQMLRCAQHDTAVFSYHPALVFSYFGYLTFRNGHDFCSHDKFDLASVSLIEHRHLHTFRAGPFDAPVPFPQWIGRTPYWCQQIRDDISFINLLQCFSPDMRLVGLLLEVCHYYTLSPFLFLNSQCFKSKLFRGLYFHMQSAGQRP